MSGQPEHNDRSNRIILALLAVAAAFRSWLMGPMWLDGSFVALSYSDRIARGGGVLLAGQTEPYEAFLNPFWVALFAFFGRLNISEVEMQAPVGILLYVLLVALVFRVVSQRCSTPVAVLVTLLLGLAPVVSAARDGGDAVFLALLSLGAAFSVSSDLRSEVESRSTMILLGLMVFSGRFAWLSAVGLTLLMLQHGHRKTVSVVSITTLVLVCLRFTFFGTWFPPMTAAPIRGVDAFVGLPAVLFVAVVGVCIALYRKRIVAPYLCVMLVGLCSAWIWGHETGGFGVSLVPVVGVLMVFCGEAMVHQSALWKSILVGLLIAGFDGVRSETTLSDVQQERLSNFHQGRGMGRFLLWRFEETDAIVVHRAGVVGYYSRRPMIDLSGVLHGRSMTPKDALMMDPVAVLPHRSIVSHKAQRIPMGTAWPDMLEGRYKQYAIQHQKQWRMVDVNPVWFHLYIRKDLPMLRPEIPKSNGNILPKKDPFGVEE